MGDGTYYTTGTSWKTRNRPLARFALPKVCLAPVYMPYEGPGWRSTCGTRLDSGCFPDPYPREMCFL